MLHTEAFTINQDLTQNLFLIRAEVQEHTHTNTHIYLTPPGGGVGLSDS